MHAFLSIIQTIPWIKDAKLEIVSKCSQRFHSTFFGVCANYRAISVKFFKTNLYEIFFFTKRFHLTEISKFHCDIIILIKTVSVQYKSSPCLIRFHREGKYQLHTNDSMKLLETDLLITHFSKSNQIRYNYIADAKKLYIQTKLKCGPTSRDSSTATYYKD